MYRAQFGEFVWLKGLKTRRSTTRTRFSQYFVERAREPASLGTLPSDNGDVHENVDKRFQRTDRRPSSNRDSQVNLKVGRFTSWQGRQRNVQKSVTRAEFLFFSLNLLLFYVLVAVAVAVVVS